MGAEIVRTIGIVRARCKIARGVRAAGPSAWPHAQVDFGECIGVIGGVRMKLRVFCFNLPQSDACFIKAYPAETTEAFLNGHVSAFAFFRRSSTRGPRASDRSLGSPPISACCRAMRLGRDAIDNVNVVSKEMPPPGTIMWTCGWWVSADPQVCSTEVTPIRVPRCLGSATIVIIVSAEALNIRL